MILKTRAGRCCMLREKDQGTVTCQRNARWRATLLLRDSQPGHATEYCFSHLVVCHRCRHTNTYEMLIDQRVFDHVNRQLLRCGLGPFDRDHSEIRWDWVDRPEDAILAESTEELVAV